MRVVSHKKLKDFYETKGCEDSRVALERWYDIAEKAEWRNLSDIKADFLSTDYVGNQHYVFNIRGNNYRISPKPSRVLIGIHFCPLGGNS